jgi:hypothetical protein
MTREKMTNPTLDTDRQRRVRRNAILLGLLALGFYVAFIVLSVLHR